jgi:hypothetical protein
MAKLALERVETSAVPTATIRHGTEGWSKSFMKEYSIPARFILDLLKIF